ncbi:hypothetical protein B0H16DRAFT_150150 [Mycena metata]|uniref:Arrestin-like N-terminal domain-containing protein n=1 Tax=Mycena metata TaxID=1033252 RepID=A0AAD7NSN9_9AGAR|nr:hypothetical protein B0H16DRAFT_150150 [Mycena metata]
MYQMNSSASGPRWQLLLSHIMPIDEELPSYASALARRTEHKSSLETKGKPWLSVFTQSRAGTAAARAFFVEGDTVVGRVELNLEKDEALKSISVSVQASVTTLGQQELPVVFLDLTRVLWNEPSGKLAKGKYSWPFSFALPHQVNFPANGITVPPEVKTDGKFITVDAPPSFSEHGTPSYIDYKMVVTVKRGTFVAKANQTLTTLISYLPLRQPEPPSPLRQLAYEEASELIGPDGDSAGWRVLEPVKFKGKLFQAVDVEVECTLAIATPLAFATGSHIPLILTLKSKNEPALDTLATAQAIKLYLVRSIAVGSDAMQDGVERRSNQSFVSGAGQAYFWPSTEGGSEPGRRVMRGEVEVKKQTKPSFVFPRFTVRYTLELLPFATSGFISLGTEPLISKPVKITTRNIPGITPRSYRPPGYVKPQDTDYNMEVGSSANGAQRILVGFI